MKVGKTQFKERFVREDSGQPRLKICSKMVYGRGLLCLGSPLLEADGDGSDDDGDGDNDGPQDVPRRV